MDTKARSGSQVIKVEALVLVELLCALPTFFKTIDTRVLCI